MLQPYKLCRACSTLVEETFQEEAFKHFQKFHDLYSTLTELKVYDDDDLPKILCTTCVGFFESIENFKETCIRSVESIRKLILANLKEEPIEEIVSAEMLEPILKVEKNEGAAKETDFEQEQEFKEPTFRMILSKKVRPICALCDKSFANRKGIRKHMNLELKRLTEGKEVKVKIEPRSKPVKTEDEESRCPYEGCRRSFKFQSCLKKHIKKHEERKTTARCTTCHKQFVSVAHYRRHLRVHQSESEKPKLTCPLCKETFTTGHKLKLHTTSQHPEELFVCRTCDIRFPVEKDLEAHRLAAHPFLRFYICHHCGKLRSSKSSMLNHLKNQHYDPVYEPCPVCSVKVVKAKMVAHCRHKHSVRTDIPIIECKYCKKVFKQNCVLRRHLRSHTGERPFVCHLCGMAFIRSGSLKKHFYSHSGERPIHCDHCGKGLYSSHALKIHMNIHKREWIAQGQTGIELMVYPTSNKSKNSTERKYANINQPRNC